MLNASQMLATAALILDTKVQFFSGNKGEELIEWCHQEMFD